MAVPAQRDDLHFVIRVPGWLIAGLLVALAAWWLVAKAPWDTGDGPVSLQPMATLLQSETKDGAWSGRVLLEADGPVDDPAAGWVLANGDRSQALPLAARTVAPPAGTRGVLVELVALLPEGFRPAYVDRPGFAVLQQAMEGSTDE